MSLTNEKAMANGLEFITKKFGFTGQEMSEVPQNPFADQRKAIDYTVGIQNLTLRNTEAFEIQTF